MKNEKAGLCDHALLSAFISSVAALVQTSRTSDLISARHTGVVLQGKVCVCEGSEIMKKPFFYLMIKQKDSNWDLKRSVAFYIMLLHSQ